MLTTKIVGVRVLQTVYQDFPSFRVPKFQNGFACVLRSRFSSLKLSKFLFSQRRNNKPMKCDNDMDDSLPSPTIILFLKQIFSLVSIW